MYCLKLRKCTKMTEIKYEDEPIFIEVFERKEGEQEAD